MPLRKSALAWLLGKEWREMLASRAWWFFLLLMGPLVGVSFISAVTTYGEASGLNGTSAGVGEAFSPLVGIWAPTFSACELAAAFLLPFVAIRLFAGDRQSGALKLELQHRMSAFTRVAVKALVLMFGWLIALLAPLIGVFLWKLYGGSIYLPELLTVIFGHLLNAGVTIGLAATAAAITEHPATAAIVTLAITVGSWIINFIAAVHGGWWESVAGYTPTAMIAEFQRGLIRLDVVLIALALISASLELAAVWLRLGIQVRRRVNESLAIVVVAAMVIFASAWLRPSRDLSENRMNSFSRADEIALRQIQLPLHIEVHLAPEDPRRVDLERRALVKLRRVMPRLRVDYISATSIGLFEQSSAGYGEIWYEMSGRRQTSRATTPEAVLENIYALARVTPPESNEDFRGHPLAAQPRGAAWIFYGVWPVLVVTTGFVMQRRQQ